MIKGSIITLHPATRKDRWRIYNWCFHSETTKSHSGPPDYPEKPIATYQEFCDEYYEKYYFTGTQPRKGQGFLIVNKEEAVGFISYSSFHMKPATAELDIWMKDEMNCGKGYGNDAIQTLCDYLNQQLKMKLFVLAPATKNIRAIRSYEKAGFRRSKTPMTHFLKSEYVSVYGSGDYGIEETTILVRCFDS